MTRKTIGLAVGVLVCSLFTGTIVISIGVGSQFTSVNTAMAPLVCPGEVIVPAWRYRGHELGFFGPSVKNRWVCVDKSTGHGHIEGYRTTFTAGAVYGLLLAIAAGLALWGFGAFRREAETRY